MKLAQLFFFGVAFAAEKPERFFDTRVAPILTKRCLGCHNASTKLIGPSYRDIAAKYKKDAEARAKVAAQVHKGGSGKWGPIIMPPFPQVSDSELKVLTDWILGLD